MTRTHRVLAFASIWVPYLVSTAFFYKSVLAICDPAALFLTTFFWGISCAFVYFTSKMALHELQFVQQEDAMSFFVVLFFVSVAFGVVQAGARHVILGSNPTCGFSSFYVLVVWLGGYIVAFLATEGLVATHQKG